MRIYITPSCQDAIERLHLTESIATLVKRAGAATHQLPEFKPCGPYWKLRRGDCRLLARRVRVDREDIMCLVAAFRRADKAYDDFLLTMSNQRPAPDSRRYDEESAAHIVAAWLNEQRRREDRVGAAGNEQLPEALALWLQPAQPLLPDSSLIVYETKQWVDAFLGDREVWRFWQTYHDLVINAADDARRNQTELPCETASLVASRELKGRSIVYVRLPGPALLLLEASNGTVSAEMLDQHRARAQVIFGTRLYEVPGAEQLRPNAARCYPEYILGSSDHWGKIEEHEEGNLALSPEQEELLHHIFTPNGAPVFINGRAGSGKSLMLHYVLADLIYLEETIADYSSGAVIYLTCNEQLLEHARESVSAILATNCRFAETGRTLSADRIRSIVKEQMQPFRRLLIDNLDAEAKQKFLPENLVDFARFSHVYGSWAGRPRSMGPEICWHVIRVYLQGYFFDFGQEDRTASFGPEDYAEIGRRDRTVSDEDFKKIYEKVWPWYRELCRADQLWDEQDLCRYLLMQEKDLKAYSAVLCDEAQDLTRLDLQLVLKLAAYTRYGLNHIANVQWLPFVFAGDPFQTLNPTGFLASSLTRAFHEEVVSVLDPDDRWRIRLTVREMKNNYRSTHEIVALSNLIQLTRRCLFAETEIRPQACWFQIPGFQPMRFVLGENVTAEQIRENLAETILIVPCEEGGEAEFVLRDPELREIVRPGQADLKNVLSASASKGLEFNKVVLYKFGSEFAQKRMGIGELLRRREELSDSDRLWAEYFFNKLYVAVSRGVRNVFIVDTKDGDSSLWSALSARREELLALSGDPTGWDELTTTTVALGGHFNIVREENPEAIAAEFETKGRTGRNAELLERAAGYWDSMRKAERAKRCRAEANEIRGRFRDSGTLYQELGGADDRTKALECFWRGHCWTDYLGMGVDATQPRAILAALMAAKGGETVIPLLEMLAQDISAVEEFSKQWVEGLKQLAAELAAQKLDLSSRLWATGAGVMAKFAYIDRTAFLRAEAICWLRAGVAEQAMTAFERLKEKDPEVQKSREYNLARAEVAGMPVGLEFLEKADEWDQIIAEWEKVENSPRLEPAAWVGSVARAFERRNMFWKAFRVLLGSSGADPKRLRELFEKSLDSTSNDELHAGALQLIDVFANERRFAQAAEILTSVIKLWASMTPDRKVDLGARILERLAVSDEYYGSEPRDTREPLSDMARWAKDLPEEKLSWVVLGAALERIGYEVEALSYYERFLQHPTRSQYARRRWIASKYRQLQMNPDRRAESELTERAQEWQLGTGPMSRFPEPQAVLHPETCEGRSEPPKRATEELSFLHLRLTIQRDRHLVLLTDPDFYTVRCDIAAKKVTGERVRILEQSDDIIRFVFEAEREQNAVEITVRFTATPVLELRHRSRSQRVQI